MKQLTFGQKLKLAWKVMQSGAKPLPKRAVVVKSTLSQAAKNMQAQPVWHLIDYLTYATEGYAENPNVRGAIDYKARSLTTAPLRAYTGDIYAPQPVLEQNELGNLLDQPNQWQSGYEFQQASTIYLNIHGNSFIYLDRKDAGEMPRAMYCLRPDRVFIVPKDSNIPDEMGLAGYLYVPRNRSIHEPFPILPHNMLHIKYPNPLDDHEGIGYGMSPLSSGAQSIDVDNQVTYFLKTFFDNNTMLGGILKFDEDLSDDEVDEARERFQDIYGGVENWGGVAVLDKKGSYQSVAMSFKDMMFKEIDARNEARILMPLGVPGMLIGARGAMERSTFSNFEQADRVFWNNTFIPELRLHEIEYRNKLTVNGFFPKFDTSRVPALQQNLKELTETAHKLWTMGTPRRLAFQAVGLTIAETPNDMISYIPSSVIDAAAPVLPAPKPAPVKEPKQVVDEGDFETDEEGSAKKKLESFQDGTKPKRKPLVSNLMQ